jgi:GTP cyclohydrolase I
MIPDIHKLNEVRNIPIDMVGIRGVRQPISIMSIHGLIQCTVAKCDLFVNLLANEKGAHMSRMIDIINKETLGPNISDFENLLSLTASRLEARRAFLSLSFPYFIRKQAPISGATGNLDYDASIYCEWKFGKFRTFLSVTVPITSLCQCSKEISDFGAHNQRSYVKLTIRAIEPIFFEELIGLVEKEASCEIFSLLKRVDEKCVTERAYQNPKFVEDIIRDVASKVNELNHIEYYNIEVENIESIHNHSVFAAIEKGIK